MENSNQGNVGNELLVNAVFERVRPEMMALKPEELLSISLDISPAVATVLGVLPEVRALREQIVKELPTFDIGRFDAVEDYALALSFAHAKFLSATQAPDDLEALSAESLKVRERLLAEVNALVQHGIVGEAQISQLKGANGYKNVATDLMVLTNVIQSVWPQVQGKLLTTSQDLEGALRVATRLLRVVGLREQGPAQVAQATDERLRAYTLLMVAYDDVRRAVGYLRSQQGDADDIAPGLHPGRPRSKRSGAEPQAPVAAPAAPVVTGAPGAPTPAAPAHPANTAPVAPEPSKSAPTNGPFM